MKRVIAAIAVLAVVALFTVAAQAESAGEKLFAQKCTMCHQVKGKGGTIGPDLTKVGAKLKDSEMKAKLENPKKNNPTSTMPSFKTLSKGDADALVTYLKSLK